MTQLLRLLIQLSWGLGLLSILAAVIVKFANLDSRVHVTGHTLFLVAGAFFLCTLATRAVENYSSERMIDATESLYEQILGLHK